MNPFSNISMFDPKNKLFDGGRLIMVKAMAAGGKSLCINSLILNYIDKGVDVLLFTEAARHSYTGLQQTIENITFEKSRKIRAGLLYMCPVVFENPVEYFIEQLHAFIPFHNHHLGSFVIVIDGEMFGFSKSFDFTTISPNTRIVLFEKIDKNLKKLQFKPLDTLNRRMLITEKHIVLKNVAIKYNSHIVCSQHMGNMTNVLGASNASSFISDMIIRVKKNSEHFEVDIIKYRSGEEKSYICELNQANLTLLKV